MWQWMWQWMWRWMWQWQWQRGGCAGRRDRRGSQSLFFFAPKVYVKKKKIVFFNCKVVFWNLLVFFFSFSPKNKKRTATFFPFDIFISCGFSA
jgi:hypothetical protein